MANKKPITIKLSYEDVKVIQFGLNDITRNESRKSEWVDAKRISNYLATILRASV
jgi:hypothetical protein